MKIYEENSSRHIDVDDFSPIHPFGGNNKHFEENQEAEEIEEGRIRSPKIKPNFHDD